MTSHLHPTLRKLAVGLGLLILLEAPGTLLGEPPPATAVAAFDSYILALEARLSRQHRDPAGFLVQWPAAGSPRLLRGEPVLERLSPPPAGAPDGALLHHWRATAFVPGAHAAGFERLLRDLGSYPRVFAPGVTEARLLSPTPGTDRVQVAMRVRQHHVVTVVLDTAYDTEFGRLDPTRGYSLSRSVRIAEVAAPGTSAEHTLGAGDDHGFLWRQNTYWTWEERGQGLYLQIESVSLTRAIPAGLGWAVRPYVESIPRESLAFTLRAAASALSEAQSPRSTR